MNFVEAATQHSHREEVSNNTLDSVTMAIIS